MSSPDFGAVHSRCLLDQLRGRIRVKHDGIATEAAMPVRDGGGDPGLLANVVVFSVCGDHRPRALRAFSSA